MVPRHTFAQTPQQRPVVSSGNADVCATKCGNSRSNQHLLAGKRRRVHFKKKTQIRHNQSDLHGFGFNEQNISLLRGTERKNHLQMKWLNRLAHE